MSLPFESPLPPQISDIALERTLNRLEAFGPVGLAARAMNAVNEHDPIFADCLQLLGVQYEAIAPEPEWPQRVLHIAAPIALYAYRNSGFEQNISKRAIIEGLTLASLEGVPEAFQKSSKGDTGLEIILSELHKFSELTETDEKGYHQMLTIGSGITRYFLRQAIDNDSAI